MSSQFFRLSIVSSILCLGMSMPFIAKADAFTLCDALANSSNYEDKQSYRILVQGKDGWVFRTSTDIRDEYQFNSAAKNNFSGLNSALEKQGIELVMVLPATRAMLHYDMLPEGPLKDNYNVETAVKNYDEYASKLQKAGLTVATVKKQTSGKPLFYKIDHHWTAEGARLAALSVKDAIKDLPAYQELEKATFKTTVGKTVDYEGSFAEYINEKCQTKLPFEKAQLITTEKVSSEETDETALFGDEKEPEIVLIGTSNSTNPEPSYSNFEGALKETLQADVLNLSISGGGVDSPMLSWLASERYKQHKPKFVIWEVPSYVRFGMGGFFRQATPAVYGDCGEKAIASTKHKIDGKSFQLFENLEDKNIQGNSYYLYLKLENFKKRKFKVVFHHQNGTQDNFKFKRKKRYPHDGIYFVEFDKNIESPASDIKIVLPKEMQGSIEARICKIP